MYMLSEFGPAEYGDFRRGEPNRILRLGAHIGAVCTTRWLLDADSAVPVFKFPTRINDVIVAAHNRQKVYFDILDAQFRPLCQAKGVFDDGHWSSVRSQPILVDGIPIIDGYFHRPCHKSTFARTSHNFLRAVEGWRDYTQNDVLVSLN